MSTCTIYTKRYSSTSSSLVPRTVQVIFLCTCMCKHNNTYPRIMKMCTVFVKGKKEREREIKFGFTNDKSWYGERSYHTEREREKKTTSRLLLQPHPCNKCSDVVA